MVQLSDFEEILSSSGNFADLRNKNHILIHFIKDLLFKS